MRVAVAAALALLTSSSAQAFLCTRTPNGGPSVAWSERTVVMQRSGGSADVGTAAIDDVLVASAAAWTDVDCSDFALVIGAPTQIRVVGFDWHKGSDDPLNQNIVVFRNDTPGDPLDQWLHTFGALAITTVTFESNTGRLLDADIEVNDVSFDFTACDEGRDPGCTVRFDLQNTLTHEMGHVLGLDHPPSSEPDAALATMFASAAERDTDKRDLADDDVAGLCTLYPSGDPPGECFGVGRPALPAVRFEQTMCASTGADGVGLAVGLLLLLRARGAKTRRRRS